MSPEILMFPQGRVVSVFAVHARGSGDCGREVGAAPPLRPHPEHHVLDQSALVVIYVGPRSRFIQVPVRQRGLSCGGQRILDSHHRTLGADIPVRCGLVLSAQAESSCGADQLSFDRVAPCLHDDLAAGWYSYQIGTTSGACAPPRLSATDRIPTRTPARNSSRHVPT